MQPLGDNKKSRVEECRGQGHRVSEQVPWFRMNTDRSQEQQSPDRQGRRRSESDVGNVPEKHPPKDRRGEGDKISQEVGLGQRGVEERHVPQAQVDRQESATQGDGDMVTKGHTFPHSGSAPQSNPGVEQEQHGGGDQRPEAAGGDRPDLTEPNEHSPERQTSHCEQCARNRPSSRLTTDSTTQTLHHHTPPYLSFPLTATVSRPKRPTPAPSTATRADTSTITHISTICDRSIY